MLLALGSLDYFYTFFVSRMQFNIMPLGVSEYFQIRKFPLNAVSFPAAVISEDAVGFSQHVEMFANYEKPVSDGSGGHFPEKRAGKIKFLKFILKRYSSSEPSQKISNPCITFK